MVGFGVVQCTSNIHGQVVIYRQGDKGSDNRWKPSLNNGPSHFFQVFHKTQKADLGLSILIRQQGAVVGHKRVIKVGTGL